MMKKKKKLCTNINKPRFKPQGFGYAFALTQPPYTELRKRKQISAGVLYSNFNLDFR